MTPKKTTIEHQAAADHKLHLRSSTEIGIIPTEEEINQLKLE